MTDATAALCEALGALATPARVHLLRELRTPKTVTEVRLQLPGGRVLARQTVKEHLDRLVGAGVVAAREAERPHGPALEYVVDHRMLFSLGEELRALALLRPSDPPPGLTQVAPPPMSGPRRKGPHLVLVKGLDEGRVFDLAPRAPGKAAWTLGRKRGLDVVLDFDATVSAEHARVTWDGAAHRLEDLPHSRNGTRLNYREMQKGVAVALEPGDVVGVGRTALVFQA